MNALDCTDIKALLSALIDDRLDDHTRHCVERHLSECESCRAYVNDAERLDALVAMSAELTMRGATDLPRGFEEAVFAQTARAQPPQPLIFRSVVTWTGWFAAAASIVLAVFIWMSDQQLIAPERPLIALNGTEEPSTSRIAQAPAPDREEEVHHLAAAPREAHRDEYSTGRNFQSRTSDVVFTSREQARVNDRLDTNSGFFAALDEPGVLGPPSFASHIARMTGEDAPAAGRARAIPAISRDEAEAIYSVSLLMRVLEDADLGSFAEIESIRRVALADDLIDRLGEARDRVDPADRPALLAAESVLVRIVDGPLDRDDVRLLSETVGELNLQAEIGEITERWDRAYAL